eukprot:6476126-Prymnesium_polylepis.1
MRVLKSQHLDLKKWHFLVLGGSMILTPVRDHSQLMVVSSPVYLAIGYIATLASPRVPALA